MKTPAHKDTEHPAGQIVNPIPEQAYATPWNKKLTFEEWYMRIEDHTYDKTEYDCMKMAWLAGQENK